MKPAMSPAEPRRRQLLRTSLALVGLGLLAGCSALPRQVMEPLPLPHIGWLSAGAAEANAASLTSFRRGLADLGYVEGQTIAIDGRWSDGRSERLPILAAELMRLPVAIIVAGGTAAIRAAREATSVVPIVMTLASDPVAAGFAESLAKPGGNITGITSIAAELAGKRLELLKATLPLLARLALLSPADSPDGSLQVQDVERVAPAFGIQVQGFEVHTAEDLERSVRAAAAGRAEALYVAGGGLFSTVRGEIAALAARYRLPATYPDRRWVAVGGLMAYAPDPDADFRRAAAYVDKILKGARPADLPIERPTKLDFAINVKAAQGLGLTIPPSVLQQATEVIP